MMRALRQRIAARFIWRILNDLEANLYTMAYTPYDSFAYAIANLSAEINRTKIVIWLVVGGFDNSDLPS